MENNRNNRINKIIENNRNNRINKIIKNNRNNRINKIVENNRNNRINKIMENNRKKQTCDIQFESTPNQRSENAKNKYQIKNRLANSSSNDCSRKITRR